MGGASLTETIQLRVPRSGQENREGTTGRQRLPKDERTILSIIKSKIPGLMLISAITVALGMILANHLVLGQVREEALRQARLQQERSLSTLRELVNARGRDFRIEKGALWTGEYRINGNNEIPDKVLAITGSRATIFMHDTRVATSVLLDDGRRAEGTRLKGPAYEAVLGKGSPYRGEAIVMGASYLSAYEPIRGRSGEIIGALFVGVKKDEYLAGYQLTCRRIQAINGTLAGIFVLCALLLLCERKRSEDAMQKQLSFLRILSDTIPIPLFYRDREGRYSGFNKALELFLGKSAEELMGKTVDEVWPEDLARRCRQMDRELMENPGSQCYESRVDHADGTCHDVIFYKATFWDELGGPGGIVGVMLDITERKAAEEEIRNAYQRTSDILEFIPDGVFVVDREKRVIAWNRAMEAMTGVSKTQILGKGELDYSLPFYGRRREMLIDLLDEDEEEIARRYENGKKAGSTIFGEMRIEGYRGGEDCILRGAAAPLFDREGEQIGGIQTIRDITDLRKSAQEKNKLEAQMHHSRMTELLMVQLSHDLKTPLTPLFALLPMVARGVADPQLARMLDICQKSADQIQGLAEKSLHLVRLSSPANHPEPLAVPLAQVAEQAMQGVADQLAQRRMSCHNLIDPELQVLGARDQLELLLSNLLSNAARYGAEGGKVRLQGEEREGTVTVSVHDDGIGLENEHTSLIFSEFFKADSARHDLNAQGLGLAICQRIVVNHGGRIWAVSPGKGRGTTILFTLKGLKKGQQGH